MPHPGQDQRDGSGRHADPDFHRLLDTLPAGAYTCDPDGLITYFNARAVEVWGRAPKLNDPVDRFCGSFKLFTPDGVPIAHDSCWMGLALRDSKEYNGCEIVVERPDGTRRAVLAHANPFFDEAGRVRGAVNVLVDITDRKQAEERVRRSERELADFFENAPVPMHWVGGDGRVMRVNRAEIDLLGYDRAEEVVGRPIADFHADPPTISDILCRLKSGAALNDYPARLRCKDGSVRHVLIDSNVNWDGDRFLHTRCFTRDITRQKQAEDELRHVNHTLTTLVRSAPLPVVVIDPDPPLVRLWNPAAERVFGWAEAEVLGRPLPIIPEEKLDEFRAYRATVAAGRTFDGLETTRRRKDGTRVEISLSAAPLRDAAGKVTGLLLMFTDITERIRAEEAVREADRRKTEFLAMLAHELRNPLAPIRNGLHVMRLAGNDPAVGERAREMMERQLGHMVRLIDDLLDLSRITKGKIELRRDRIELAAAVQDAVEACRPQIQAAGHELTVSLPPAPVYLDADRTRLAQVFANLLNNSAKYTPRGGHIRLTAERQGSDAVVTVADDGAGIPPDLLPRVFEMFTQADRSLERAQGGLGIGLSLVKGLVEMHGGSVAAKSDGPEKGSEFTVRLPVALPLARESDADPFNGEARAPAHRILVVDDNEDAAVSLAMMLQIMGHNTRTAHDGHSGLAVTAAFRPDVILLDIGLPGLNGFEVCRRIREQPWGERMVLIALTGWGQDEDRRRSKEAGFNFHMVKPVDPAALTKLLSGLLLTPA